MDIDKAIEKASKDYANLPPIDFGDPESIKTYAKYYDAWFKLTRKRDFDGHKGE